MVLTKRLIYRGAITCDITEAAQSLAPCERIHISGFNGFRDLRDFSRKMPSMWHKHRGCLYKVRTNYFTNSYTIYNRGWAR